MFLDHYVSHSSIFQHTLYFQFPLFQKCMYFDHDVILPSMNLQYGNKHNYKGEQLAIQDSRIFLSTLLILREVMAQNAEAIFGLSAFNTASNQSENDGHHHSVSQLSASVLASSIILTGLDTLGGEFAGRLAEKFLGMMDDYDNGRACFRDSLPIANQTAGPPAVAIIKASWIESFS